MGVSLSYLSHVKYILDTSKLLTNPIGFVYVVDNEHYYCLSLSPIHNPFGEGRIYSEKRKLQVLSTRVKNTRIAKIAMVVNRIGLN